MIPAASNISTLYINMIKTTTSSIQINEVLAVNDPNKPIVTYTPSLITFAVATGGSATTNPAYPITNMVDGNLDTFWQASARPNPGFPITCTYEFNFTFNTTVPRINFIQLYTGPFAQGFSAFGITGIVVYTNSSKQSVLYSNVLTTQYTSLGVNQKGYMFLGFNIIKI